VDFNDYSFCHSSNGFKILSREWMLLHLVGHLAFQHTFIKIHWLLEVKLYIAKYKNEIDWIKFNLLLKKFQFLNSWILTKHFIDLVFNNKRSKNLFLNYLCNLDFILFPEKHKVRYYLIKYLTKDSSKTFIGYAWHWLIASGWKK
jgi:hypothetical protein